MKQTIIIENLTIGGSGSEASSYGTASISPTPGRVVLVGVQSESKDGSYAIPTLSGVNMTWTQIATISGTQGRNTLFRGLATAPIAGAITINLGEAQFNCSWVVDEVAGCVRSGSNAADAIVQSASANGVAPTTGLTVTLGALAHAKNIAYGMVIAKEATGITPGSGFTELAEHHTSGNGRMQSQYKANDNTVDWTWASNAGAVRGIAVELKAAPFSGAGGLLAII